MNGGRTRETVKKLWSASRSLQGGGVSYYEYVTELTYLLLLKMLEEVKRHGKPLEERLPANYRWQELKRLEGEKRLKHYRKVLLDLGDKRKVAFDLVNQIYKDAKTSLTKATALTTLVNAIDEVDWYAAEEDGLGDLYEGLLEKTTSERKSKAGQYFTPRPLIDTIIELVKPEAGKVIQDPAAGTGGFIIAAHRAISAATNDLVSLTPSEAFFQKNGAYQGAELITGTHRLNTMNLLLHGIETPLKCIDTLSSDGEHFDPADLILTNPPFNKFPERVTRSDFVITAGAAKGPLPFVEHVVRALKVGGRAAIVVTDNILFEDNMGRQLRTWRHCHVGQFYLSMARRAYGPHTAKSMACRVREWRWTPRESAILGRRDNAVRMTSISGFDRAPDLLRMPGGTRALPTSWRSAACNSRC